MKTIELSEDDFDLLILALGVAACNIRDPQLFSRLLKLANTVNKDNPRWKPYEVVEPCVKPS